MSKLPWDSTLSVFYNRGQNFKADASRLNLAGQPIPNSTGDTREFGVTLTTFQDRLSLKIARFKTTVSNATLAGTEGDSIGGIGSNASFLANGVAWGYGWATYLQDALANNGDGRNGALLNVYGDYAGADGFTRGTPAEAAAALDYNLHGGVAPNGRTYAGGLAVVDAWLHVPLPAGYLASYNSTPRLDPALGSASGNLRDSYPAVYNDASLVQTSTGGDFGNHQTTADNLSSGTEIELTFQPVRDWNITMNFTRTHATRQNIDPASRAFISTMTGFINGPGGQIRMWSNGDAGMLVGQWNSNIVAPYTVELNELGHEAPEVAPWRLNVVTTYALDHGLLKGLFFGGAFREEAGRIIGYHFNSTLRNANSDDPNYANVSFLTLGGLDVNQPFRGRNDWHFDAWLGYSRKLTRALDWRIQLNLRSVGEHDHLVSARINPDGNIALARIEQGMGWQLTNAFDF
jgi:hypothetical protein